MYILPDLRLGKLYTGNPILLALQFLLTRTYNLLETSTTKLLEKEEKF